MSKNSLVITYLLFSHHSCNICAVLDNDVDEEKVGLNFEDREEKNEEDNDDQEISGKDVDGSNGDEEEDIPNNTKE